MAQELRRINVLEVNTSFGYAGAQRTMISFCAYLNKDFFVPYAVSYGEGGPREKDLKQLGIEYLVAQFDIERICEFACEKQVHVIHVHRSGHYIPFEFQLIQKLHEVLPEAVIIETNVFGKFDEKSDPFISCHLLKSKMMLNERFVKEVGNFDFDRMKVIYNPVDYQLFEQYRITPSEISQYKKTLGIPEGDMVIGRLGRADISKWSDLVLDMIPYLIKELPRTKFIIQAAPDSRIRYVNKKAWKKNIIFLPETNSESEVHRFYQTIDILAHSSKIGEAFGNTLNEAMYWKKPVVVNSTPRKDNGQKEQIEHLKTGIIANTPETYARAIVYLANNPELRRELGENGHVKVTTEYEPTITTRRLEKVLVEKLAEENKIKIDPKIIDFYCKIAYYPSEEDITSYKEEYHKNLYSEFGKLTVRERVVNYLRHPTRLHRKIRDFIEHRLS